MKLSANKVNSMSLMETDSVLTTDDAIEYLKISKPTFLKYIRLGRIRAIKAGKGWRVLQSELYRFLKGKRSTAVKDSRKQPASSMAWATCGIWAGWAATSRWHPHMSGEERVSLLEELRYELSTVTGNDYSQRLRRVLSYSKRPQR